LTTGHENWPDWQSGLFQELMMSGDDDYVYDDESGEWIPASEMRAKQADAAKAAEVVVRDSVGNVLADGDQVTLIKDLDVKGAGQVLRRGTLIKSIRLTGDPQEIDCRYEGIKGLVLRAEFVKKR
jgi:protein PhnA